MLSLYYRLVYTVSTLLRVVEANLNLTMGHGANDKMYITHAEHSGLLGQHSSSSGFKGKAENNTADARQPFDCCAISLQPFVHPVCAPHEDGTGTVYDLLNIVPWLKEHDNTEPHTGAKLAPSSLITLHYARNAKGQLHDPISFKTLSEHSHIVAIRTTGNVFLAESVGKLAGGRDLVSDVPFTREDIISLQNPYAASTPAQQAPPQTIAAATPSSTPAAPSPVIISPVVPSESTEVEKKVAPALRAAKAVQPYNASPYSTGAAGASLTSTSLDPLTKGEMALYDEEELMYDDISRERKEKDRIRRRAYVRMVTNMGGSLNLELFCDKAPKTCYNFLMLARQGKYDDCPFHRLIPGFMIQGGDPTGTGRGGESYWGTPFRDEYDLKGAEKHSERGMLSMANKGASTNGSQFFLTFKPTPHLDGKHTVFGKLVGGEDVLSAMEVAPVKPGTDKPVKPIKITEVVIYQDPFEDYKKRLAKKQAAVEDLSSATASGTAAKSGKAGAKPEDDVNWFGEKIGRGAAVATAPRNATSVGAGVGKYLNVGAPAMATMTAAGVKRPMPPVSLGQETKKKKKLGFGDFDSW
ncbi:Peptidyl-prolyl cis-trans isomerase cyp8 [Tulasnella sp. JGI-2019a]|nr:Peptidyl-prolyl cis-trans isomerase cyp8 [Tulasnella sp. JGI-2019a]